MNYEQAYQWLHGDRKEYSGCRAAAEAMEAEIKALRKDAERYRVLRREGYLDRFIGELHPCDEGRREELIDRRVDEWSALSATRAVGAA